MELKVKFVEAAVGPAAFTRPCTSKKATNKNDRIDRIFGVRIFITGRIVAFDRKMEERNRCRLR